MTADGGGAGRAAGRPLVIAHRGASGYRPEHTLPAFRLAIALSADAIEPDLVMTGDGVLVVRHENAIGETTDVADRPAFRARRTSKTIDGRLVADTWFTEDFTLAELKTLRCRERLADLRPANRRFDGEAEIATFAEVLALAAAENDRRRRAARGGAWRRLGVYPETKHPSYFRGLGLAMEAPLLAALAAAGYVRAGDGAYIQSFETASLRWLRPRTDLPLVQLLAGDGEPWDLAAAGDPRRFADLATAAGLAFLARHADGIGVEKDLVIRRTAAGGLGEPGRLVADAHAEGLFVHAWTFRAENAFLPAGLRLGGEAGGHGDLAAEIRAFLAAGIDGLFTDHPDIARRTVDADPAG